MVRVIRHRSVGCAGRIRIVIVLGWLLLAVLSVPAHRVNAASATGSGVVLADVDYESGKVTAVRILQSTGNPTLDAAALATFRKWRFKAKTIRHVKIPITFTLNGMKPYASGTSTVTRRESAAAVVPSPVHGRPESFAVDAKGMRHRGIDYNATPPWISDAIKTSAPEYPFQERLKHDQGSGIVRLTLDLKSGSVAQATVIKSTGFTTLDRCAIAAFRQWKWKPGKWKEIDMPVTFEMANPNGPWPRGSLPLPPARSP
jgi:TonB family protein